MKMNKQRLPILAVYTHWMFANGVGFAGQKKNRGPGKNLSYGVDARVWAPGHHGGRRMLSPLRQ